VVVAGGHPVLIVADSALVTDRSPGDLISVVMALFCRDRTCKGFQ
jgi:hypothetical protein